MEATANEQEAAQPVPQPEAAQQYQEPQLTQQLPICPHCGDDPVKLTLMFQKFPKGQIASIISCTSCRRLLSVQIVGVEQSPIVKPGR